MSTKRELRKELTDRIERKTCLKAILGGNFGGLPGSRATKQGRLVEQFGGVLIRLVHLGEEVWDQYALNVERDSCGQIIFTRSVVDYVVARRLGYEVKRGGVGDGRRFRAQLREVRVSWRRNQQVLNPGTLEVLSLQENETAGKIANESGAKYTLFDEKISLTPEDFHTTLKGISRYICRGNFESGVLDTNAAYLHNVSILLDRGADVRRVLEILYRRWYNINTHRSKKRFSNEFGFTAYRVRIPEYKCCYHDSRGDIRTDIIHCTDLDLTELEKRKVRACWLQAGQSPEAFVEPYDVDRLKAVCAYLSHNGLDHYKHTKRIRKKK